MKGGLKGGFKGGFKGGLKEGFKGGLQGKLRGLQEVLQGTYQGRPQAGVKGLEGWLEGGRLVPVLALRGLPNQNAFTNTKEKEKCFMVVFVAKKRK